MQVLADQRAAFLRDGFPDAAVRIDRIDRLQAMLLANRQRLTAALDSDYGTRPAALSTIADVVSGLTEMTYMQKHLASWMRPHRPSRMARLLGVTMEVHSVPLGVVGIMGPWNFPLQLVIQPAAAALAAGNRVMIRPSSATPRTSAVLAEAAREHFSPDELVVLTGEDCSGSEFASLPFDHLFFTGSPATGKEIQKAAAANLTPVTLELGGKNPAVVSSAADLARAAKRIAAARMVNSGQVCLAPDLVFVPEGRVETFVGAVLEHWRARYPAVAANDQYVSIIDDRQYLRIVGLVDDAVARGATARTAVPAGESLPDAGRRKIAPTVLTGVRPEMEIADEEIFGPVLAVYGYRDIDEVIEYLSDRPSPLSSYWYGPEDDDYRRFLARTRSGGVNRNDFGLVNAMHHLPFGGVGRSGMGAYHGRHGFDTFSHRRSVAGHAFPFSLAQTIATPHSKRTARMIERYAESQRRAVAKRLARRAAEG